MDDKENTSPSRGRKREVLPLPMEYILKHFKYEEGDDPSLPIVRMDKPNGRNPKHGSNEDYRPIKIQGKKYKVSRVVWALVNGADIPAGYEIDHIDRDPGNNIVSNLRLVTIPENNLNRRFMGSTSRFRGVSWFPKAGKFGTRVMVQGNRVFLGLFEDDLTAARVYDAAVEYVFGPDHGHPTNASEGLLPPEVTFDLPQTVKDKIDRIYSPVMLARKGMWALAA